MTARLPDELDIRPSTRENLRQTLRIIRWNERILPALAQERGTPGQVRGLLRLEGHHGPEKTAAREGLGWREHQTGRDVGAVGEAERVQPLRGESVALTRGD